MSSSDRVQHEKNEYNDSILDKIYNNKITRSTKDKWTVQWSPHKIKSCLMMAHMLPKHVAKLEKNYIEQKDILKYEYLNCYY
jgi:hypothetical protein